MEEGVGIGLRREHFSSIQKTDRQIDWLEIIPENFIANGGVGGKTLDACAERWPIGVHGVSMSLGGPDPIDRGHIELVKALLDRLGVPVFTEHLCFATAHGQNFYDLLPLPFTHEAALHIARRVKQVQEMLERPILLENVSTYAIMPGAEMTEGEFVTTVIEEAGCGLMLDVNNVYVNAHNHGTDAHADLQALPLEKTGRIHLAGHKYVGDLAVDNHGSPVIDPVWQMYSEALHRTGPAPTLIEWDMEIPPLDRVIDEADKARAIWQKFATPEAVGGEA
ncbi:MAG: DUF692 domain-containing protein [Bradymonadia bacterium]